MNLSWPSNFGAQNWCATCGCSDMSYKIVGPQLAVQLWHTKLVRRSLMFNYGAQKMCASVGCRTIAHNIEGETPIADMFHQLDMTGVQ